MNDRQENREVCIIGAGLAGLSAALYLARRDIPITLIERENIPAGLASSIAFGGGRVERFYHFICGCDAELIQLIERVGLKDKLHRRPCSTTYFHDQRLYPFGTPFDLLRFGPTPFCQRIRFGLISLKAAIAKSGFDWTGNRPRSG
jgi:protoporphyrinogen oxidase